MADRWGSGRHRPEPHPCSGFLRAIYAVDPTPAGSRFGACSQTGPSAPQQPDNIAQLPDTRPKTGQVKTAVAAPLAYRMTGRVSENTNYPASDQLVSYTLAWTECFYTTNCVGSQWYAATTDRGISAHLIRSDEAHCVGTVPSTDPPLVLSPVHCMSPVPCQLERRS